MEIYVEVKRLRSVPLFQIDNSNEIILFAAIDKPIIIPPSGQLLVPTGISVKVPDGFEAWIKPRRDLIYDGIDIVPDTIKPGDRDEVEVLVRNFCCKKMHSIEETLARTGQVNNVGFWLEPGVELARLVIVPVVDIVLVEDATETMIDNPLSVLFDDDEEEETNPYVILGE